MSSDIFSKEEKYRILSFTKLEPMVEIRGKGATLKDVEGKEYLDFYAGISVVNAGHCSPKIVKAVERAHGEGGHVAWCYSRNPLRAFSRLA